MMDDVRFPLLSISRLRMGTDGNGVTALAAGAGCPLHCRWCINRRLLRDVLPEWITPGELLERVKIDDLYFRATGGGVTFGGGESLLHADFIRQFRETIPPEWKVNAETSLAVPEEQLLTALGAVDFFIVDCKDMNEETYRRYTGGEISLMERNLGLLLRMAGPERVLVRVPRIPEYNTEEDQKQSAEKLRKMGAANLELFEYVRRAANGPVE